MRIRNDPKWQGGCAKPSPSCSSEPTETEMFYSDSEDDDDMGDGNNLTVNLTSESAYEADISTYATNTLLDTRQKRRMKKNKWAPILRTSYYGRKRLTIGKRHFVSSAIEYSAGATLGSSARKIPFYSLLVSHDKPTSKNKVPEPIQVNVICETGTSISLAPLLIAQSLKMRIDKSHLMSVRGADGNKISSMGTSFIYMKAPASPSWRRVKVVITKTGENFLLSHAALKNLNLLSDNFPEYLG